MKKLRSLDIVTISIIVIMFFIGIFLNEVLFAAIGALFSFILVRILLEIYLRRIKNGNYKPKTLINLIVYFIILFVGMLLSVFSMIGALAILTIYRNIFLIFASKLLIE